MSDNKKGPQTTKEKALRFAMVFGVGMAVFIAITVLRHM